MAIRFFKRINIVPGISVNLSKRGASVSVGPRGGKITAGTSGVRATTGLPGTGLYYTSPIKSSKSKPKNKTTEVISQQQSSKLNISFFQRLLIPNHKKAFIDGCKNMLEGNDSGALENFQKDKHPDCTFMCGFINIKLKNKEEALKYLELTKDNSQKLGELFSEYGILPTLKLKITDHIYSEMTTDLRSLYLLLVEFYQENGKIDDAIQLLESLIQSISDDYIVILSYSEILLEINNEDSNKKVIELIGNIENESEVHTCLMYYKCISLNRLGLNTAA